MENKLAKVEDYSLQKKEMTELKIDLQKFLKLLDKKPKTVLKHKEGFSYVPVDQVENELNTNFFGVWNWLITDVKVVGNEILVWGVLEVYHPIANTWLKRSGSGASQIRMRKGAEISDINQKLKTALQMDFPHAETQAMKNAAQKFGKIFGGGLRRDFTTKYIGYNLESTDIENKEDFQKYQIDIDTFDDPNELIDKADAIKKEAKEKLSAGDYAELCKYIQKHYDKISGGNNG